jgi:hypothetical protein
MNAQLRHWPPQITAIGSWSTAVNPGTKTIAVSAVLLHTGKVLIFGGKYKASDINTAAYLYDPVTGTGHEVPAPGPVFCGSVTQLSDGRVLSVGGADPIPKGATDVWLFDPISEQWIRQPNTPLGRYYPTSTKLPDGRVVVTAGNDTNGQPNPTVEVYTPPSAGGSVGTLQVVGPPHKTAFYRRRRWRADRLLLAPVPVPGHTSCDHRRTRAGELRRRLLHRHLRTCGHPCGPDGA